MHQKNKEGQSSASTHDKDDEDDDDNPTDPFADTEEDMDDEDAADDRGSWWRGVVKRRGKSDGNESDDEGEDDDDEFGDFAMAEDERGDDDGKVVLRPLAVNPAKEGSRGLSGLWPFGLSKAEKEKEALHDDDDDKPGFDDDFTSFDEKGEGEGKRAVEVREAKRRTSIEDPDDEEVVV